MLARDGHSLGRRSVGAFHGSLACGHLKKLQPDLCYSVLVESKPACDLVRDVQLAAFDIGTAVVDANNLAAVVARVYHPHDGPERKSRVRRSGGIHIIGFAIGGRLTVEIVSIPAGGAFPYGKRLSG